MASTDPWDWSVDDVVEAFCGWTSVAPRTQLPDPQILETKLREQEVNGSTLLTAIDHVVLKEEFGIKPLGQRNAIVLAINRLRPQSQFPVRQPAPSAAVGADVGVHIRPGEILVEDEHGRKRRKLNLSAPLPQSGEARPEAMSVDARDGALPEIGPHGDQPGQGSSQVVMSKKEQRDNHRPFKDQHARINIRGFLGRQKLPVDRVFFDETAIGQELPTDTDMITTEEGLKAATGFEFAFVNSVEAEGVQRYVQKQMRHFMLGPERDEITRSGQPATVVHPYRDSLRGDQSRHAILFERNGERVSATKQDATLQDSDLPLDTNDNHDWDFLMHWNKEKGGDEVLPVLGESDDDSVYSSTFVAELEAERKEAEESANSKRGPLTMEEKFTVMDEEVNSLAESWRARKLPLREARAWNVWSSAKTLKQRTILITKAEQRIEMFNTRIQKYKVDIFQQIWDKASDLRQQCQILEQTVFDREEESFKISVWRRQHPPPRLTGTVRSKKRIARVHDSEGGESVGSESDAASEVDDIIEEPAVTDADGPGIPAVGSAEASPEPLQQTIADPKLSSPDGHDNEESLPEPNVDDEMDDEMDDEVDDKMDADLDALLMPIEAADTASEYIPSAHSSPAPLLKAKSEPRVLNPIRSTEVIDLTISSSPSKASSEPPTDNESLRKLVSQRSKPLTGSPEDASVEDVRAWPWSMLEERNDRKRLVIKLLRTMTQPADYRSMKKYLEAKTESKFTAKVKESLNDMEKGQSDSAEGKSSKLKIITRFSRLYMCWHLCSHRFWSGDIASEKIRACQVKTFDKDFEPFYQFLRIVLLHTEGPAEITSEQPTAAVQPFPRLKITHRSSEEQRELSEETSPPLCRSPELEFFDQVGAASTPHRKRKRNLQKSSSTLAAQQSAAERQRAQAEREKELREQYGSNFSLDDNRIIVNTGRSDEEAFIYINPHIGADIKKHQIEGVQFMWREIVSAGGSETSGCLLAHTMGLGKTMQAITLLVTIAEAAASGDPAVFEQIPGNLRKSRSMILCPPSLILNWQDELLRWAPDPRAKNIGQIHYITSEIKLPDRLEVINDWYHDGGVLIIGYEMLRMLVENKSKGGQAPLNPEQHDVTAKQLLNGPNIIVADEAHKLKRSTTGVSKVAARFKSRSRVALTGSPLANNLEEYWAMINWISPGYLGDLPEFKSNYKEPIEEGLYAESTPYEHRRALKKLAVLKNDIDPKVNRADITVLKDNLKPKIEFVITVPLTPLQEEAYKLFVRSLLSGLSDDVANTRLWSWLAILNLLCNHPKTFIDKITQKDVKKRPKKSAKQPKVADEPEDEAVDAADNPEVIPSDVDVSELKLSTSLVQQLEHLFAAIDRPISSTKYSHKVEMFVRILKLARDAGDRVLVFSHSIPTLDYLAELLTKLKKRFARLDGKTGMSRRQKLSKDFNDSDDYDVFLISTRAGGLGFNLPGANRVVIFDFSFNPTWEEQAIGRSYRIGQDKPVFVYRLIAGGTFETKIWDTAVFKTQLASRVVDRKNPMRYAAKSRDMLFKPKPVQQMDLSDYKGKDPQVLDYILESSDIIRAISTTETLQKEAGDDLTAEEKDEVKQMIAEEKLKKENPALWRTRQAQAAQAPEAARDEAWQRQFAALVATGNQPGLAGHTTDFSASQMSANPGPHPLTANFAPANMTQRHDSSTTPPEATTIAIDSVEKGDAPAPESPPPVQYAATPPSSPPPMTSPRDSPDSVLGPPVKPDAITPPATADAGSTQATSDASKPSPSNVLDTLRNTFRWPRN
ncbi:hypothetical protein H2199_004539 [Coniosporium tulheliwenetii]|uniref:Uncharacterized protein n=1 Tax=Coniosporium tulheliwenetii TaxID=3383036 RepID=A0ACC2Z5R8_9PEZI|nr:hypothetical protein H2199_004539 [Cladosporium sp. JES 115]